ncbi:unnamed protein product [Rotaria magnacalcarata]
MMPNRIKCQLAHLYFNPKTHKECQNTTIIDGTSLIQALHQYMRKGLFKSTTLFCTFDIHNLYTMLPQEEALDILVEFLHVHGYTKVKGIPLETIRLFGGCSSSSEDIKNFE